MTKRHNRPNPFTGLLSCCDECLQWLCEEVAKPRPFTRLALGDLIRYHYRGHVPYAPLDKQCTLH
ncbi:MAG: hypothetical protein ACYTAO_02460 [Planctomycetota bacterium]